MKDYIVRGITASGEVRFFAADTSNLTDYSRRIHGTAPVATAALGRLLTAGAIMGTMFKNNTDLVTLSIKSDGPIAGLTVTSDNHANVRGLADNPFVSSDTLPPRADGHLNVGAAVGNGTLSVIRDMGTGMPYVGRTALVSGEIAEDLAMYFAESEQIPTSVALGVLVERDLSVSCSGGFIIQLLPFASEETIASIENALSRFTSVTECLRKGMSPEDMIKIILGENIIIEDKIPAGYKCACSRSKIEKALISLGTKELSDMIKDNKPAEIKCDFCETAYTFSPSDLRSLLEKAQPQ